MSEGNGEGTIRFSTKEMLVAMDTKLDTLMQMVATKAATADLIALGDRVTAMEGRLDHRDKNAHEQANRMVVIGGKLEKMEIERAGEAAVDRYRKWWMSGGALLLLATIVSIAVGVVTLVKSL